MNGARSGRFSLQRLAIIAMAVVAVLSLVFFGWATWEKVRTDAIVDEVEQVQQTRQSLRDLAERFVKELHTYGPDDLEGERLVGYEDRVAAMMTPKFQAEFGQNLLITESTVVQFSTRSAGQATASGVATVDDDSAEVLVGGWVALAYQNPDNAEAEIKGDQQPIRYRVVLQRSEGEWRVDRLCNVDASDQNCLGDGDSDGGGGPSEVPTAPPTGEAPTDGESAAESEPAESEPADGESATDGEGEEQ